MASWSNKRKLIYSVIVSVILLGAVIVPAFLVLYTPPSCSDGKRNGSEQGIDCGGSCQKLCASAFQPPRISWTRFEEISPGLYNLATYIENPNSEGEAHNVPYHVSVYDGRGMLITEFNGRATIPPQRNTLVFNRMVEVGKRLPARAILQFTGIPDWNKKADSLRSLVIGEKQYTEDAAGSSLLVPISNKSVEPVRDITVYAILYGTDGNVVGFSRTVIDEIAPNGTAEAPFTWPNTHGGRVVSIEVLPVAE